MKYFADAKECRQVIESYMGDLSKDNQNRMQIIIDTCKQLKEKEQIFNMTTGFRSCLWDIPEAVTMGFHKWMEENIPQRLAAIQYHEGLI